jgi:hypothetical protein
MQIQCMHCIFFILSLNNKTIYSYDYQNIKKFNKKMLSKIISIQAIQIEKKAWLSLLFLPD